MMRKKLELAQKVNAKLPVTFSVNIFGDQFNDWSDNLATLQDVIDFIIEQIKNQDDSSCFLNANIRVFSETELCVQLIANKHSNYSIQDFIIDLAQMSNDIKEVEINDALTWVHLLEKYLAKSKMFSEEI